MRLCDITLPTPEENLAFDEALLDYCEERQQVELLRFWEPVQYFVVVGYANKAAQEANLDFCRANGIPVLRRCSGGGTVLQGPGCLNYTLILRIGKELSDHADLPEHRPTRSITSTNRFVMERLRTALARLLKGPVVVRGHTDLAVGEKKFSGNAQRRKRNCLIFHGSFLLDLDISLVEQALPLPSHRPEYRLDRSHSDFLLNLKITPSILKAGLAQVWDASEPFALEPILEQQIHRLVNEKYARGDWNLKF